MKLNRFLFAAGAALAVAYADAATTEGLFADPVVAKGKGFEIKRSELDEVATGFRATAAAKGQVIPQEQMPGIERDLLRRIVEIRLLDLRATDKEKQAGTELGTKRFDDFKKGALSEEVFNSKLKSLGSSAEKLHARLVDEAIGELVLNREVRSQVTISDDDVKKFYDDNPGRFEQPEMVKIAQIILAIRGPTGIELSEDDKKAKRDKIGEVLKKAKAGGDFAALAKQYSEDPNAKEKGGELPPVGRDAFRDLPELETAAFSLAPGQMTDVIATQLGYHIIKLIEKIPAKRTPLADVTKEVKQFLEDREVTKRMPDYFDKVKKELNVEMLLDSGNKVTSAPK